MSAPTATAPHTPHTPIGRVLGVSIALAALVAVVVLAFAWPSVTAEPHNLPVAIAGPEQAVTAVTAALDEKQPDVLAFDEVDDRDAAVAAIEKREVYGAIILSGTPGTAPEVLTSSAANLAVSQLLTGIGSALEAQVNAQAAAAASAAGAPAPAHIAVTVTDVVPLAASDPRGTGLTAAMFPLVMGGMIGGIAISIAVIGALRRVLAVVVYSAVGGLVLTGILAGWFGVLEGDFWAEAAVIALALAAIAAPITGAVALLGRAGIAVGPIVMMLFANPISGAAMPREFLPGVWGQIGQWFPPGAAANLLRDVSYFPQADASFSWLVLGAWTVGGLLLSVLGHFRTAGGAESDELAAHEDDREPASLPA
ncbi:MAG: hypothetical protein J0I43_12200 [Microbacterium sp.]|uniref:hypothetical protein n=1 Tax=Microbacterium sp. TaxID=51671 RepID=UPI001AD41D9D|nr:hypothetical protein [Microbacterium sp.]MBN9178111.1 hypothetical protein [Microbacterium sp.]